MYVPPAFMDNITLENGSSPEHEPVSDDELLADEAPSAVADSKQSSSADDQVQLLSRPLESPEGLTQRPRVRPGEVLAGKYRVERVHAAGVLGTTVDAQHLQLEQRVALKLSLDDSREFPARNARFLRAARLAAQFRNDHVARILDIDSLDSGTAYVVSEHFSGTDLRGVLRVREWLPPAEAINYLVQACEGLAEAHVAGLVHGNIKLSNLFLARELDARPKIKVLDFAILDGAPGEGSLAVCGSSTPVESLAYLAPEQIREPGLGDVRTDIWALGAVLHELLTGVPVYAASTAPGLFAAIAADPPTPITHFRSELPTELEDVVLRCLEKDPQARYPDLGTFVRQLRPFAEPQQLESIDHIILVLERRARLSRSTGSSTSPSAGSASAARRAIVRVPPAPTPPAPAPRRALELGLAALAVIGLSVGVGAFIVVHNLQTILATRTVIERPTVASLSPALPAPIPTVAPVAVAPVTPASALAAAAAPPVAQNRPRFAPAKAAPNRATPRADVPSTPYDDLPSAAPRAAAPATTAQALFENPN